MKSPGHQKWPDHKVSEQPVRDRVQVEVNGELLADSRDVIKVEEDGHPARYYFPRTDIQMDKLEPSSTTTECPFKGTAHYFNVNAGGRKLEDAVWTYEDAYDEHRALAGRLAFYEGTAPGLSIRTSSAQ